MKNLNTIRKNIIKNTNIGNVDRKTFEFVVNNGQLFNCALAEKDVLRNNLKWINENSEEFDNWVRETLEFEPRTVRACLIMIFSQHSVVETDICFNYVH